MSPLYEEDLISENYVHLKLRQISFRNIILLHKSNTVSPDLNLFATFE